MYTVLTRLVTESTVVVCLDVKKMKFVVRIYLTDFFEISMIELYVQSLMESKLSMRAVVSNSMYYIYSVLKLCSFLFFSYYKKYKIISVFIRQFACNCWRNSWRIRDCSNRSYFGYYCCTV